MPGPSLTLREALAFGRERLAGSSAERLSPGRDAELLLLHATGLTRAQLLADPGAPLPAAQHTVYAAALDRRAAAEPIQYITGTQEFFGRAFRVTPAVLIPRPETEHLVEAALALPRAQEQFHVADVGTGSGILAVTLALELGKGEQRGNVTVTATDISAAALDLARENAATLGTSPQIRFVEADLLAGTAATAEDGRRYQLIVSNPPYVPSTENLPLQVAEYEPHTALFAGPDGLAIYRLLIPQAASALAPGGHLLLEIGHGQQAAVAELLAEAGLGNIQFLPDLASIPRVAIARKP